MPVTLGGAACELRCGQLPEELAYGLGILGVSGVIGAELLMTRRAGYFPGRAKLVLA